MAKSILFSQVRPNAKAAQLRGTVITALESEATDTIRKSAQMVPESRCPKAKLPRCLGDTEKFLTSFYTKYRGNPKKVFWASSNCC